LLIAGGLEVSKDTLKGMLVVWARVSGVVTQGSDGIAKVRMGPQHGIHEGTKGMLIRLGRNFRGLELDKVLVGKGWSRDRTGVGHSMAFKDLPYKVLLGEGDGSLLTIAVHMDA